MFAERFQHLAEIERKRIPPTPEDHLRLHRLERPEEWSWALVRAVWAAQEPFNLYPDYAPFYEDLSAFIGRPVEQIVVGAGIEDFIRSLMLLCCEPGDAVAFTWPTCAMFDIYAKVFGAEAVRIVPTPDERLTADAMINAIFAKRPKLVILPNPGQPVESYLPPAEMAVLASYCRGADTVLAIDEAYYGFGAETCLPLIDEFENVVVLRTFSKAFGGAGLRVGYAMAKGKIARTLDAIRTSGETAGPSLVAAQVLMRNWEGFVEPGIREVCEGRDWLKWMLEGIGYRVEGSLANHVLIDMATPERASVAAERLLGQGVHVRKNAAPLDRYLMVTCGSQHLMERFLAAFEKIDLKTA